MYRLRIIGITINVTSYVYVYNMIVITDWYPPISGPNINHSYIAYHKIMGAVMAGVILFYYTPIKTNVSDILTKKTGNGKNYPLIRRLMMLVFKKD